MIDAKVTLHVLIDLHRTLASESSLERQLDRVARAGLGLLEADHTSIRVLDDGGTELLSGARAGAGVDHRPVTFGRGVGVAGWVVDHGEVVRLEEVGKDPRFVEVIGQGFDIRSMLAVPLAISGNVIGVMVATSARAAAFAPEHEDLALLLATIAASPIERARLEAMAVRDPSTRAFGPRYLAPRIAGEVRRAGESGAPLAVIAMELDGLRELREQVGGRAAVEALLRTAVDRVLGVLGARGVVIRREGGELVILMPGARAEDAERVADRIAERLAKRITRLGAGLEAIQLTACAGVVEWSGRESATRLERRADEALRRAQRTGPGTIGIWDPPPEG